MIFSRKRILKSETGIDFLILLVFWICLIFLVRPVGEFSLYDDWAYARSVYNLVIEHKLKLVSFSAVTMLAQVLWGALFCLPFGFSFTALRMSTIVLGFIGGLTSYVMLKEAGAKRPSALLGAVLVLVNPLYFQLSNSFMTDVPFAVGSFLCVYFLIRFGRNEKQSDVIWASIFGIFAVLTRQVALIVPIAFVMSYIAAGKVRFRNAAWVFLPLFFIGGSLFLYEKILTAMNALPLWYQVRGSLSFILHAIYLDSTYQQLPVVFLYRFINTLAFLGIYLWPLVWIGAVSLWNFGSGKKKIMLAGCVALFVFLVYRFVQNLILWIPAPMLGDFGFSDTSPKAYPWVWNLLTLIGALNGGILLFFILLPMMVALRNVVCRRVSDHTVWASFFIAVSCIVYFTACVIAGHFDRYQIFYLPLLGTLIVMQSYACKARFSMAAKMLSLVLVLVITFFSIVWVHDTAAVTRTKWRALFDLLAINHSNPMKIDGGGEFNGWFTYTIDPDFKPFKPGREWWGWWAKNAEYGIVGYGPDVSLPAMTLQRYETRIWFPPKTVYIHAVKINKGNQ